MNGRIRNVVFDMDGVIFDTERISAQSWRAAAQEVGIPELGDAIRDYYGLNAADSLALFTSTYGNQLSYDRWRALTNDRTEAYIRQNGLPVKRGARELLCYLRDAGAGVAMATSTSRERVMDYLERSELKPFFQRVVTGDMVVRGKPEPDIYLTACRMLGARPGETLAVEDSMNGLRSAAAAGLMPVMVPDMVPPNDRIRPLLYGLCDSLLDVIDLIERVNNQ